MRRHFALVPLSEEHHHSSRLAGRPPLLRHFSIAHLAGRPLTPAEQSFVTTLTGCCAKQADYAAACIGTPPIRRARPRTRS